MRIKNFLFHRVTPSVEPWWPPMQPELFDRVIAYLMRSHTILPLEQAALDPPRLSHGKPYATICFDDGFEDNATVAADILARHRCPATFFLVTDAITYNRPTWTYSLDLQLHLTARPALELSLADVPEEFRCVVLGGPDRPARCAAFKRWAKTLSAESRKLLLMAVNEQINDVPMPRVMMNWGQARALLHAGFSIGSHTATHEMLGTTTDTARIDTELRTSAETLTRELGQRPLSVAYPVGSYSELVIERTRLAGYQLGFAVHQRFYRTDSDQRYAIPRVELYQEPWLRTWLRTTATFEQMRRWMGR